MKHLFTAIILLCTLTLSVHSEVLFSDLNINGENDFLFSATQFFPGFGDYKTLFSGSAEDQSLAALTFFPEKSWFNKSTSTLFIQNRYGLYKSSADYKSMMPVKGFLSFVNGETIKDGKILSVNISPDGTKLLYVKAISIVKGELHLFNMLSGESQDLKTEIDLTFENDYALWSPDSKLFIYGKGDSLYYFSLEQFAEKRVLTEQLRKVGDGKLNSISWNEEDESSILYFINGGIVYRLDSSDIFTRSLYSGEFNMSKVAGRVPFDFEPGFDSFKISPDGERGLVVKNGRDLILYDMNKTDYRANGKRVRSLPYLQLPKSMEVQQLIWADSGKLVILATNRNTTQSMVFTHDPSGDRPLEFIQSVDRGIVSISLSPDEQKIVLAGAEGVTLRIFQSWNVLAYRVHVHPLNLFWLNNDSVLVAGSQNTSVYNFKDDSSFISSFAQCDKSGFTKDGRTAIMQGETKYLYNEYDGTWTSTGRYTSIIEPLTFTQDYRIFLETAPSSLYNNRIMIKKNDTIKSIALFNSPQSRFDPFPAVEENLNSLVFDHGSRVRQRDVALVFNLYDSVAGLSEILNVLSDYQIKATFFINGEFIRRHPDATKELQMSGHEIGSMFYADFDMTDTRYQINKDFILRGLSYNEDEYFSATGKELEPLWHAPYYFVNSDIIEVSENHNYAYIGRDLDSLDWVAKDSGGTLSSIYFRSSEIIERIVKMKQPGSIIPITVGKNATRDDYLFSKIDLLIEALKTSGYDLVTISKLIENSK
ncbi:MAG: polysaccharide deacetylase family protein [Spirochaetaceae bacterium]|nr:polysaccharide deacetylase family protein [Spirochaetaceae bacterium]